MLQVNKSSQPVNTQIQANTRPTLTVPKPKSKGPSAQGTSFLRRRKIVQVLAARAEENYVKPEPKLELAVYEDFPILDVEEEGELQGEIYPQLSRHQQLMANPEHDECLVGEYWAVQGMLHGSSVEDLSLLNYGRAPSVDM
jgi:hypothetical protein